MESLGSICPNHMNPEHNSTKTAFTVDTRSRLEWTCGFKDNHLLSASLDGRFCSKGSWYLKTGKNKSNNSMVVDTKNSSVSRLSLLNRTS